MSDNSWETYYDDQGRPINRQQQSQQPQQPNLNINASEWTPNARAGTSQTASRYPQQVQGQQHQQPYYSGYQSQGYQGQQQSGYGQGNPYGQYYQGQGQGYQSQYTNPSGGQGYYGQSQPAQQHQYVPQVRGQSYQSTQTQAAPQVLPKPAPKGPVVMPSMPKGPISLTGNTVKIEVPKPKGPISLTSDSGIKVEMPKPVGPISIGADVPVVNEASKPVEAPAQNNVEKLDEELDDTHLNDGDDEENYDDAINKQGEAKVEEIAEPIVEEEEEDEVDYVDAAKHLPPADPREPVNIVFIGHVDAGKSTLSGSILYEMGTVDARTIEKYKTEAKEKNRESWFLAFIMDTNEEERAKGKTVEVGRAHFCSDVKRYTILDAPGHKNYVPAMIAGAAQADVGILVISARKGEFEAGFDRMGQTREHAMLAKTLGVQKLIVVINKMDEVTVQWDKKRYDECVNKITPFLKQCGFLVKKHVIFLPISAISGDNVKRPVSAETCKWATELNDNKSLMEILDEMVMLGRDVNAPLRIPVLDKYQDRGLMVMGKIEGGYVEKGQKVCVLPNNLNCIVDAVFAYVSVDEGEETTKNEDEGETCGSGIAQREVSVARVGENVLLRMKGLNDDDIMKGFVLSERRRKAKKSQTFMAQLQLLELLPHRSVFSAGYTCVLHVHTAIEECTVLALLKEMDPKTGKPKESKTRPRFVKSGGVVWCRIRTENQVCIEEFAKVMPLGRFTLRDEGKTIAIGKVVKVDEA